MPAASMLTLVPKGTTTTALQSVHASFSSSSPDASHDEDEEVRKHVLCLMYEGDFKRIKQFVDENGDQLKRLASSNDLLKLLDAAVDEKPKLGGYVDPLKSTESRESRKRNLLTVLQLAASGVQSELFNRLRDAYEEQLGKDEAFAILTSANQKGVTVLMAAAGSGSIEVFRATLEAVTNALSGDDDKLINAITSADDDGATVLMAAARSGNIDILRTTLEPVTEALGGDELIGAVTSTDVSGVSILMAAAETGSIAIFREVLKAVRDALGGDDKKIKMQLVRRCDGNQSLLKFAATGRTADERKKEVLKAVVDACRSHKASQEEIRGMKHFSVNPPTKLMEIVEAADTKGFPRFCQKLRDASNEEKRRGLEVRNLLGDSLLSKAAASKNLGVFAAILDCAWELLKHYQLRELFTLKDIVGNRLLSSDRIQHSHGCSGLLMSRAYKSGDYGLFEAAAKCVVVPGRRPMRWPVNFRRESSPGRRRSFADKMDLLDPACEKDVRLPENDRSLLGSALVDQDNWLCHQAFGEEVALQGRTLEMDSVFETCAKIFLENPSRRSDSQRAGEDLSTLSSLIACSARPSADIVKRLHDFGDGFVTCCLRAVTSASNPFIPGMTLSIRLGEVAKQLTEGERKTMDGIQSSVDELMLEIFERLPQTVRGFDEMGGPDACARAFELETNERNGLGGPLQMMLSSQQHLQMFCRVPLVMDYLTSKFTLGLPDLKDTEGLLRNAQQLNYLASGQTKGQENNLVIKDDFGLSQLPWFEPYSRRRDFVKLIGHILVNPGSLLQAADASVPNLVYFPGAQFIIAGMVAAPRKYYKVPAMRMALDFVVYVGMVAILSYCVFFHAVTERASGNGSTLGSTPSWEERGCALAFVLAGVFREAREMRRDIRRYFKDQWNVLDSLGLLFLLVGLVIRWHDLASPWGPAFYALSAPLVISRVLFFAQILPFQGPMIEVIFRMASTLVQFGFVMLVVMIGFAMALYALFRDVETSNAFGEPTDIFGDTFGEAMLALFKAMLGDTELFEEFEIYGGRFYIVATILLVAYLLIMTIMLLNLLVAILSTAHAKVQENVGGEFRVSKARVIEYYTLVVEDDLLPAPFNLLQLVIRSVMALLGHKVSPWEKLKYRWARRRFSWAHPLPRAPVQAPALPAGRAPALTSLAVDLLLIPWSPAVKFVKRVWRAGSDSRNDSDWGFGPLVFALVLGPVAVCVGWLLWIGSALPVFPYAQYAWYTQYMETKGKSREPCSVGLRCVVITAYCLVGAPLSLLLLWAQTSVWMMLGCLLCSSGRAVERPTREATRGTVESLLKMGPGGVGAEQLREFLEDPMNDKDVRQDEKAKPTTVEHIKLLRNRLETTREDGLKKLLKELKENVASKKELKELRDEVNVVLFIVKYLSK